jgi:diguanylate cyclase (GGDEF)-like protein
MGFMGVAYTVRAVVAALNPQTGVAPLSLSGSHQSMLIVGALFVVSSTISFYSMVHDEQKHEIAERAKRDPLTGLFNRRAFFDMANPLEREQAPFAILMIDIDHFKSINDTHGHLGGDAVLSHAGRLILGAFRIDDIACRFGGEEFCVLLRNCDAGQAMERASHLVTQFNRQPIRLPGGEEVRVSVSVGVCQHLPGRGTLRTIQNADLALYDAKHGGRNQARLARDGAAEDRAGGERLQAAAT